MCTPTRRTLLAGAGALGIAATLSGCAAYGDTGAASTGGGTGAGGGTGEDRTAAGAAPGSPGTGLTRTGDIPIGGGKVLADQKLVVTQPVAGQFRCFTAICTHAGCVVGDVSGGTVNCPCHGSKFKIADGTVANGPAKQPLAEVAIKVDGGTITRA